MRAYYIAGIILAVLVGGVMAYFVFATPEVREEKSSEVAVSTPSGPTISIYTRDGKVATVSDFTFNKPRVVAEESDVTYVYATQNADGVEEDPRFGIVYGSDSTFVVGLFQEPLGESRKRAEARLRALLPLPDDILCLLRISVIVPDTIGPMYRGRDLGLSFCPGAVFLP